MCPYIKTPDRKKPDQIVSLMHRLRINIHGELKKILIIYGRDHIKLSYNNLKNYCGELHQCGVEILRRLDNHTPVGSTVSYTKKIKEVVDLMVSLNIKANGDLNYILFKFCKESKFDKEYFKDELDDTIKSIEKFILAPYEDKKIIENRDV